MDTRTKIVSEARAREMSQKRSAKWVDGHFDPLLAEHARRLREAAEPGRLLIVEVTNPPRPLLSPRARAELVAALECVDVVVISDREAPSASDLAVTKRLTQHVRERINGAAV